MKKALMGGIILWSILILSGIGFMVYLFVSGAGTIFEWGGKDWGGQTALVKEERFSVRSLAGLEIETVYENIDIQLVDGDTITVRQYGQPDRDVLFTSSVTNTGGEERLTIGINNKRFQWFSWSPSNRLKRLEVDVPDQYAGDVILTAVSGSISIRQQPSWNQVSVRTTSGDLQLPKGIAGQDAVLRSISGDIFLGDSTVKTLSAETTSGGIEVGAVQAEGMASLNSVSGDISAASLMCKQFKCNTLSGTFIARRMSGEGIIKTVSGDIQAGNLAILGPTDVSSTSGRVTMQMTPGQSFEANFSSLSGDITSEVPMVTTGSKSAGIVGSGGPRLNVKTVSGDIHITEDAQLGD